MEPPLLQKFVFLRASAPPRELLFSGSTTKNEKSAAVTSRKSLQKAKAPACKRLGLCKFHFE